MIDIVIPVYNEGGNIKKLFDCLAAEINSPFKTTVVYDFDEDDTLPAIKNIRDGYSFEIDKVKNMYGSGALNAILTGMRCSKEEAVLVLMADLSDGLDAVDPMYEKIKGGEADIVCGSRYMKGGRQTGGPVLKGAFSKIAGISLHFLTKIPTHDVTNSFKMYRKSMLDEIEIESNGGFEIGMEIAVKAYLSGFRVVELPASWQDRTDGESHFHMWRWMPHYLHWYFTCVSGAWFGKRKGIK